MSRRWLTRTLVALAVPALTVPALAAPAAAAKAPDVPTVKQVARIYPHLQGGTAYASPIKKVLAPGKNCKPGKKIKGASGTSVSWMSADPANDYPSTKARPSLYASALKFPSAKAAIRYLHPPKSKKKCPVGNPPGSSDVKATVKRFTFKLGNERWGYTVTIKDGKQKTVSHSLVVRAGKFVVSTGAMSMDGKAPSKAKAIKLTKLVLKAAR